jgi:hypothetical protein
METTGNRLRRTRKSGQEGKPVGPSGIEVKSSSFVSFRSNRLRCSDYIRGALANLLDDGIGDTMVGDAVDIL